MINTKTRNKVSSAEPQPAPRTRGLILPAPGYRQRLLHEMKRQRLIRLRPGKRRVVVGNEFPIAQKIKFRAPDIRRQLPQRAIEI